MTKSCDCTLSQESLATYGALLTVGQAFLGAGCCLAGNDLGSMTKSCYLICYVSVATCAGVSGVALIGASRSSYHCLVGMTKSVNLVCYVSVATYGTSVGGVALIGASRSSYLCLVGMTKSCYLICYVSVATYGTSVGGVACIGASRSSYHCLIGMLKSFYLICYVSVATYGTSVSGVALIGASRISYNCLVGMTKSFYLICYVSVATVGAGVSGVACIGASRSGYNCLVSMIKLGASSNYSASCAAAFTSTTSGLCAVLGASCIVVVTVSAIVVAELLNENFMTYSTNLIVSAVRFRAGNVCALSAGNYANIAAVFTLFGDFNFGLAVALGAAEFYVMVAGDLADLAATVTICIASVVVDMAAGDGKCVKELLCYVSIATLKSVGDVYEEYVTHHYSVSKGMDGSKVCNNVEDLIRGNGNATNGDLGVKRSVNLIKKSVSVVVESGYVVANGNGDHVNHLAKAGGSSLNVSVACKKETGYELLSLLELSGDLNVENEVGSLCQESVVLLHSKVKKLTNRKLDLVDLLAKSVNSGANVSVTGKDELVYELGSALKLSGKLKRENEVIYECECLVVLIHSKLEELANVDLNLNVVDRSDISDELINLCGNGDLGKLDRFKDLSESEGVLVDVELEINVVTVVVAKKSNGGICGDRIDGICVENVVGDVLVKSGLCNVKCKLDYGDIEVEFAMLAEGLVELIFADTILEPALGVLNNESVYGLVKIKIDADGLFDSCINESLGNGCANLLNVDEVLFADEGCPVVLSSLLALKLCKVFTCVLCYKSLNINVFGNHRGKACLELSGELGNEVHRVVNKRLNSGKSLVNGVVNDEGIIVAYNNKVISLKVNLACSNLCPSSSLSLSEPSYVSKSFCKGSELVGDHKDLGVVGNNVLTCEDVICMVANDGYDIVESCVYVKNDAVNVCDVLTDLCKDLSCGIGNVKYDAESLSDLAHNEVVCFSKSLLDVAVDLNKVAVKLEDLVDRVVINLIKDDLYIILKLRNYSGQDVFVKRKEYELVNVVACLHSDNLCVSKVCVELILKSKNVVYKAVNGCKLVCNESCLHVCKEFSDRVKLNLECSSKLCSHAGLDGIDIGKKLNSLVDCVSGNGYVAVFVCVVVAVCVCIVVVLSDKLLYVLKSRDCAYIEFIDNAVLLKVEVDNLNNANLILDGVTFLVEYHVDHREYKLLLVELTLAVHKKSEELAAESLILLVCIISPKVLCSQFSNNFLNELEVLGDVFHGNGSLFVLIATHAGDLGNELGAAVLKLLNSLGYLLKNSKLLVKRKLLNSLGYYVGNILSSLFNGLILFYQRIECSLHNSNYILGIQNSFAVLGNNKFLKQTAYDLKLGIIICHAAILQLTVNGKDNVKLLKIGKCLVVDLTQVAKIKAEGEHNGSTAVGIPIEDGIVDKFYNSTHVDCRQVTVSSYQCIEYVVCNGHGLRIGKVTLLGECGVDSLCDSKVLVFSSRNVAVLLKNNTKVTNNFYFSGIIGSGAIEEEFIINEHHDAHSLVLGQLLILDGLVNIIKNCDDLVAGKVTVCTETNVDILNNGSVGILTKDCIKLLIYGITKLISRLHRVKDILMTLGGGMNGHTVTNLKECINLAHRAASGRAVEPTYQGIFNILRFRIVSCFGVRRKRCGRSTQSIYGIACNTHNTLNSDIHGINIRDNCCFNCTIDCNRDLLINDISS